MKHRQHHHGNLLDWMGQTVYNTDEKSPRGSGLEATAYKPAFKKEDRGRRTSQMGQHGTGSHISQNDMPVGYRDEESIDSKDETQKENDEVWFAGDHADLGGGWEVEPNSKNSSHVPLV
ncbi:hypothetical protein SLS53_005731 [Cytospora paraplurivora]|uniref:T6SS Phospholipase effector Tle1-like catalytic domain-containing protein n=1 Tax=Cytospora paraplurivora TaxID=2898453 RepID=A0AAN9U5K0_9PEZI